MDQDETWRAGRRGPGHIVLNGEPAPPQNEAQQSPLSKFSRLCLHPYNPRLMSIMAKQLDGSRCHLVGRWASALVTLC